MASESSLFGLMNQLQSLESSMAVILMESAMKISALTDANIFLLVETGEGRRFCGARHLCDAYARARLSPVGHDVEMEVNLAASGISERRVITPTAKRQEGAASKADGAASAGGGTLNDDFEDFFEDSGGGEVRAAAASGDDRSPNRKRRHLQTNLPSKNPKRFQKDLAMDVKIEMTDDLDPQSGLLMPKPPDLPTLDGECEDEIICDNYLPTPLAPSEIHAIPPADYPYSHHHPEYPSGIQTTEESYSYYHPQWSDLPSKGFSVLPHLDVPPPHSVAPSIRGLLSPRSPRGRPPNNRRPRAPSTNNSRMAIVPYQGPVQGQLNNVSGWDLAAFLSSNAKVQALQQIRDETIAEKHSTSNRLLHSVLYTVGRAIAENCAIKDKKAAEAKVFFNKIFELWWSQFPFLQELNSRGVKLQKGKKMLPLRGSVRETMQRYFGNTLDKVIQDMEHKQQYLDSSIQSNSDIGLDAI